MAELSRQPISLRQVLGALVLDLPRTLWALRSARLGDRHAPWVRLRNRHERLQPAPIAGFGVACDWPWTSDLHVASALPFVGRMILRQALATWPIGFGSHPASSAASPRISFVIGHRGRAREPQLLLTLASLAAQEDVDIECVVVEQSPQPEVRDRLPAWVRYQHTPVNPAEPYNRAWALNVGARLARAPLLVFHDNDMLVPRRYAAEMCARQDDGFEVLNLKRLIFYLGQNASDAVLKSGDVGSNLEPAYIVQNLEAGGSLAIARVALEEIGALDEGFTGWGGEDNEFWERAQTRRVWPWGYMCLLHLWHAPQPEKASGQLAPGLERYSSLAGRPVQQRIAQLRTTRWGRLDGPQRCTIL